MKEHKKNYKSHLMNKHEVEAGAVWADTAPGRIHISEALWEGRGLALRKASLPQDFSMCKWESVCAYGKRTINHSNQIS